MNEMSKYEDIINLPRPISKKHKPMSLYERSAQFASFAALVGHKDAIAETARLTNKRIELDEEEKEILDRKLSKICENINLKKQVTITYFVPDLRKDGGKYEEIKGIIRKVDDYKHCLVLEDKKEILIDNILDIEEEN